MSTVQELARTIVNLRTEDEEALALFAHTESATFEAYLSSYIVPRRDCGKGCH